MTRKHFLGTFTAGLAGLPMMAEAGHRSSYGGGVYESICRIDKLTGRLLREYVCELKRCRHWRPCGREKSLHEALCALEKHADWVRSDFENRRGLGRFHLVAADLDRVRRNARGVRSFSGCQHLLASVCKEVAAISPSHGGEEHHDHGDDHDYNQNHDPEHGGHGRGSYRNDNHRDHRERNYSTARRYSNQSTHPFFRLPRRVR